jgi:hypothetical protein
MADSPEQKNPKEIEALKIEAEKDFRAEVSALSQALLDHDLLRITDSSKIEQYLSDIDEDTVNKMADPELNDQGRVFFSELMGIVTLVVNSPDDDRDKFNAFIDKIEGRFNSYEGKMKYGSSMTAYNIREFILDVRAMMLLERYYNQTDPEEFVKQHISETFVQRAIHFDLPIPRKPALIVGEEKIQDMRLAIQDADRINQEGRVFYSEADQKALLEYMASEGPAIEAREFERNKQAHSAFAERWSDIDELTKFVLGSKDGRLPV